METQLVKKSNNTSISKIVEEIFEKPFNSEGTITIMRVS